VQNGGGPCSAAEPDCTLTRSPRSRRARSAPNEHIVLRTIPGRPLLINKKEPTIETL